MKQSKLYLAMGILFAGSVASAEGVKVGGFVAPAFMWTKGTANTFAVPDGAIYLSHSMDMAEVMVDVPFSLTSATGNALALGGSKAQAYISHKWENGLSWKLGQFDGIYGYARNDMANWAFAQDSLLRSNFQPITHTGLLLGYSFSDMLGLNILFANPANLSTRTTGTKYDMGLQIKGKMDAMHFGLGWMMSKSAAISTNLFDVMAGTEMGNMSLDFDFMMKKATGTDATMGFGLQAKTGLTDMISAAARVEWLKAGTLKTLGLTVGPQFAITKALEVRADYGMSKVTSVTATQSVNVAGVYKF